MPTRIAVLASGGGSNLQALLDHLAALGPQTPGAVALVASNRADAGALARGERHGIPTVVLREPADGDALTSLLEQHGIELVVLAGYLKLVPPAVTARWADRIVNVHPALLPAFGGAGMYGRRVHEAVLAAGARVTGVTVHLVNEQYDRGRILAQWPVPVLPGDTPEVLAARVLRAEHQLFPRAVARLAAALASGAGAADAADERASAPLPGAYVLAAADAPPPADLDLMVRLGPVRGRPHA